MEDPFSEVILKVFIQEALGIIFLKQNKNNNKQVKACTLMACEKNA